MKLQGAEKRAAKRRGKCLELKGKEIPKSDQGESTRKREKTRHRRPTHQTKQGVRLRSLQYICSPKNPWMKAGRKPPHYQQKTPPKRGKDKLSKQNCRQEREERTEMAKDRTQWREGSSVQNLIYLATVPKRAKGERQMPAWGADRQGRQTKSTATCSQVSSICAKKGRGRRYELFFWIKTPLFRD